MENPQPPEGPQSPAPAPPHQYGGPVPPGGWQQPIQQAPVPGQLAGWGARLAAWLFDALIVFVPAAILFAILAVGAVANGDDDASFVGFIVAILLTLVAAAVISLLYAPLLMMRQGPRNGQTIGKQLLDIRAVRDNGQPWNFGSAALREVVMKNLAVGIASSIIPFLPWFLNYFWPLWDDQNRALHDMAVSSHVVRA